MISSASALISHVSSTVIEKSPVDALNRAGVVVTPAPVTAAVSV
jgi:hypothetical protein